VAGETDAREHEEEREDEDEGGVLDKCEVELRA